VARVQAGDAHGAQDLIALVDSVPVREDSVAERKALDGILSLPVWKKRYDVYANWVFTQIVDALVWTQPQIQVEDGRISFGFAAAEMARSAAFADLAVHAELGSPLKAPSKKRKEGVQPDYSVLLGDQANPADVSIVEVECKQYRQARSRNFGDALHDYAHARPGAEVVLVNYGAITPKMHELIRARVAPEVHARCHMIGDFRPGEPAALAAFRDLLDETVRRRLPTSADAIQTLAVRWNGDADLDLHLEITVGGRTDTVSYQRPGTLDAEPFAHLRRDVRSGPGPEEIVVGRWLPGTYRLSIKAHSGDMDGAEPVVTIGDRTFELPEGAGRWWDVAEIDGATGVITELAGRR
jgi:hypothetical protein